LAAHLVLTIGLLCYPIRIIGGSHRSAFGLVRTAARVGLVDNFAKVLAVSLVIFSPAVACVTIGLLLRHKAARLVRWGSTLVGVGAGLTGLLFTRFGGFLPAVLIICGANTLVLGWLVQTVPESSRFKAVAFVGIGSVLFGCALLVVAPWWVLSRPSNTSAAPIAEFSTAIKQGEVLRAVEQVDPREIDVLRQSGLEVVAQLTRLGMVETDGSSDLLTSGETPNITVGSVNKLTDDVHAYDIAGLTIGAKSSAKVFGTEAPDFLTSPSHLVSVRVDGRWYVSLLHSAAEEKRTRDQKRFPLPIVPGGATTPEAAVQELFAAVAAVDENRVVASMDPVEASSAYRYARIFAEESADAQKWARENAVLSFPQLQLSTKTKDDQAVVSVTRWSAELQLPSELGVGTTVALDGNCVIATVEQEVSQHCGREIPQVVADLFGVRAPNLGDLSWLEHPEDPLEFVVVKRSGKWFVAPLRSVLNTLANRLGHIRKSDLVGKAPVDQWQRILIG
jgi:hypothetical protein